MLGGEVAGEVLHHVVAFVELEVLTAMADSAEAVAELLVLGIGKGGTDFVGLPPCVGLERAAGIEAEHMEQVVQKLEQHAAVPLAVEAVGTADIAHTVDTAGCRGCSQGNAAGNTVGTGAAAGTARLFEFGEQLLDLD